MLTETLYRHVVIPAYESVYQRRKTLRYWRELERSQWLGTEELEAGQFAALQRLLRHATEQCPYYRQQWQQAGLRVGDVQSPADFRRWPVLDKPQIREHRLAMRSERPSGRLISKTTGGSSGVPLTFDLDLGSHERRNAAMLRGYGWAGAALGTKQFYLWGVPLEQRPAWKVWKDRLFNAIQRRHVVNSFALSEDTVPQILGELNRYRPDVIVAYTGPLYQFARSLAERNLRPYSPRSLIVGAEQLHGFQRELIESVFAAPVFETYGSREFMLIGAECPKHCGLHLTTEQLVVEILDDDGQPTPDGEIGNVVITDLYNYGMPFIRYAIGDQAVAGFARCSCGRGMPLLRGVSGRRLDSLRTPDGRKVPGEFFPHLLKDFAGIRQFQVVQPALDQLELRVVLAPTWTAAEQQKLLDQVTRMMGPHVVVQLQAVPAIELTRAGKHRVVVSQVEASPDREKQP
jgi:phenylacetate-CoA ligase